MAQASYMIITYGGGEILETVFNGISSLFKDKELNNAMNITATLLGFWIIVTAIAKNSGIIPIKWFMWFLLITQLMFLPKTNVTITDPLTKYQRTVSNIPYVLGAFASTVSIVGDVLTQKMETYFSLPEDMQYRTTGTLFASKLFSQMHQYKVNDAVLRGNLHRFIQNCVVYDAMVGNKYTLKDLQESTDILSLVSDTSNIVGFQYQGSKEDKEGSRIVSCKVGIELIKNELKKEVPILANRLGSKFNLASNRLKKTTNNQTETTEKTNNQVNTAAKSEFLSRLTNSYQFMTQISKTGEELLKQEMMINAIQDASKNKAEELGSSHTYAVTKALMQQRTTYQVLGDIAAQTLPVTKVVFEVLAYTSFIFVAMLVLMPNGLQILSNYLGLLMWLQLWAPLYAVLNLIVSIIAKHKSMGLIGGQGLSMLTSVGMSNLHADLEATAFMASSIIPFVSYAIIKGGVGSFMQLSSVLNSGYQAASSHTAQELSSGNLSMGNVSYGVSSLNSFSGFKYDGNYAYQSGKMNSMNDDGTVSFMTPSGVSGFSGGVGMNVSNWEDQINMQKSLSNMTQKAISDENSNLASLSNEYSTIKNQAFRESTDFLSRMNQSGASSGSWSISGSSEQVAAASDTRNFMQELQNRYGYNSAQAAEIAGGLGIGKGIINAGANWKSNADYQDALNKGEQLSESMGVSQSLSKALRYADQFSFNENEQYEQGLAKSISGSLDRATSLRDAMSVSEQKVHRLSTMQSQVDSDAANLNRHLGQDFLEYVAKQPARVAAGGKVGVVGIQSAQKIVRAKGEEYEMYLDSYMGSKFNEFYTGASEVNSGVQHTHQGVPQTSVDHSSSIKQGANTAQVIDSANIGKVTSSAETQPVIGNENIGNKVTEDSIQSSEGGDFNLKAMNNTINEFRVKENESKEHSLAEKALSWQGKESRFIGNNQNGQTTYPEVQEKAKAAYDSGGNMPTNLDNFNVQNDNYENLREKNIGSIDLESKNALMNEVITGSNSNVTNTLDKNISDNFRELSSNYAPYNPDFKSKASIINEINQNYKEAPRTIEERNLKALEQGQKLKEEYKAANESTQIEKAVKNVFKDEKS